ncbi:hypothetical protein Tco_0971319 [Tanacetum coccineum]
MEGEDEFHDDNPPPPPPPVTPHTYALNTFCQLFISLFLERCVLAYGPWNKENYLGHTDYPIWEVIQKGNGPVQVSTDTNGQIKVLPPKTAKEILARERERKARTTLLIAIPEDHLAKFHKMTDAKEMWFQSLLSQLEIHGAGVSTEDANQKFLRVFEYDIKGSTALSSSTHNVAFVSSESTNSTNDYSFFANQSSGPQLDHEDLEQVDEFYLEDIDLKWQVAMIPIRLKKFYKKTGRRLQFVAKEPVGFDKTKMSTRDKSGLGYGNQIHECVLSYEKEVLESVFDSRSSDVEDSYVYDIFAKVKGMHAVPPPMIGNYFRYLISDCDFHEQRMAKHVELNKQKGKGTGQGENSPVWNNVQRLNHQNKFVPKAVLTKTDIFLVNTARQNPFNADHAGCVDTRKSTSGGIQFLGDKLVSWMSKKQDCTAMSSAEAEYVALSASCAQVMWMRTQLQDYGFNYNKIPLYCDSQSAIAISCNPVQHSRTKHIHTRYHFIKEQVENGIIELYFVRTEYQLADMFTKALSEDRFQYLVRRIGMRCLTPAELEVLTNESA